MKPVPIGSRVRAEFFPGPQHTADAIGNPGVAAVSTTALIVYVEDVCARVVSGHFEPGEVTVGTRVSVDHVAGAKPGDTVVVHGRLEEVKGRRLEFSTEIHVGDRLIMHGTHTRALVDVSRFDTDVVPSRRPAVETMTFWFDFHSPWCYFAAHRIGAIARRHAVRIEWKPVHLARLMDRVDGRRPLEANDRFVTWYRQDLRDHARMLGLPFEPHPDYPLRPSRALRAALFADDQGLAEPFVKRVLTGYWSEQMDIESVAVLRAVADAVGLDPEAMADATEDACYKAAIERNVEEAAQAGLFGLPAVVAGGKLFWGNDRLGLLDHLLSGEAPRLDASVAPLSAVDEARARS